MACDERHAALAGVHHRRELRLLRLVGLALRLPARRVHDLEPRARGADRPQHGGADAEAAALDRGRRRPGRARLLQVLRLLRQLVPQPGGPGRDRATARHALDRAADRDLLLHLHGDQLRRRHLPARLQAGHAREVRRLPLVLPASRRRADRPRQRADPADGGAPGPAARRHEPRLLPDRDRPLQEGRDRELPGGAHHRPGLRGAGEPLVARDPRRDLRLRRPDLRRLLRLHRHGDRDRAAPRLHLPAELRLAVRRDLAAGLLAALAHDALAMAARLPLHPARRQPEGARPDVREPDGDDAPRRPVARGVVDVRRLGRHPRDGARARAVAARPGRRGREGAGRGAHLGAAARDVQRRLLRLDLLPLRLADARLGDDQRASSPVGASPRRS